MCAVPSSDPHPPHPPPSPTRPLDDVERCHRWCVIWCVTAAEHTSSRRARTDRIAISQGRGSHASARRRSSRAIWVLRLVQALGCTAGCCSGGGGRPPDRRHSRRPHGRTRTRSQPLDVHCAACIMGSFSLSCVFQSSKDVSFLLMQGGPRVCNVLQHRWCARGQVSKCESGDGGAEPARLHVPEFMTHAAGSPARISFAPPESFRLAAKTQFVRGSS